MTPTSHINEESFEEEQLQEGTESEENRYLLFRLGKELFATPLLDVREIIQPQECKVVPHTTKHFLGVINLRGKITGVVDLRRRLKIEETISDSQVFVVFDTEGGLLAGLVDKVEAVVSFSKDAMKISKGVSNNIPTEYVTGIVPHHEELVTVLLLQKLLSKEDYSKIQAAKTSAIKKAV